MVKPAAATSAAVPERPAITERAIRLPRIPLQPTAMSHQPPHLVRAPPPLLLPMYPPPTVPVPPVPNQRTATPTVPTTPSPYPPTRSQSTAKAPHPRPALQTSTTKSSSSEPQSAHASVHSPSSWPLSPRGCGRRNVMPRPSWLHARSRLRRPILRKNPSHPTVVVVEMLPQPTPQRTDTNLRLSRQRVVTMLQSHLRLGMMPQRSPLRREGIKVGRP